MDLLKRGEVVVAFPEGTRSRDGQLQKGKPGVGFLAYWSKAVVVPAYLHGAYEALPRGSLMLKSSPIKVVYGPPLDLQEEYQGPDVRETYHRIVEKMMAGIRSAGEVGRS
jgi:1-acyl-sn-glycerol-3-phosphate acyltransferase